MNIQALMALVLAADPRLRVAQKEHRGVLGAYLRRLSVPLHLAPSVGDVLPADDSGAIDPMVLGLLPVGSVIREGTEHRKALLGRPPMQEEPTGRATARANGWALFAQYVRLDDGWYVEDDTGLQVRVEDVSDMVLQSPVLSLEGRLLRTFTPLLSEPLTGSIRQACVRFMVQVAEGKEPSALALSHYLKDPDSESMTEEELSEEIDPIRTFRACAKAYRVHPEEGVLGKIVLGKTLIGYLNCIPGGEFDRALHGPRDRDGNPDPAFRLRAQGRGFVVPLSPAAAQEAQACLRGFVLEIEKALGGTDLTAKGKRKWRKLRDKCSRLTKDISTMLSGARLGSE